MQIFSRYQLYRFFSTRRRPSVWVILAEKLKTKSFRGDKVGIVLFRRQDSQHLFNYLLHFRILKRRTGHDFRKQVEAFPEISRKRYPLDSEVIALCVCIDANPERVDCEIQFLRALRVSTLPERALHYFRDAVRPPGFQSKAIPDIHLKRDGGIDGIVFVKPDNAVGKRLPYDIRRLPGFCRFPLDMGRDFTVRDIRLHPG